MVAGWGKREITLLLRDEAGEFSFFLPLIFLPHKRMGYDN